jgi:hypothetical protein
MEKKFINMCVFSLMAKGLKVAADGAAGAGGARQQKPPQEWYTIVVYEKPRSKTVMLYVGRQTYVFNIPADVNIGNVAVIIKKWRAGGKVVACSASIHVENLMKLLAYAAKQLVLRDS